MHSHTLSRVSRGCAALVLVIFVSGCSLFGSKASDRGHGSDTLGRSDVCKRTPSQCMYKGHYEPGEQEYAVQEAKRLNQAESNKMRNW